MTAEPEVLVEEAPSKQHSEDSSNATRSAAGPDGPRDRSKYAAYQRRILDVFRNNPTYVFTTQRVFAEADIKADIKERNLGNSILSRLAESGEIERLSRGNYRWKQRGSLFLSDPPVSYHGVHMVLSEGGPSPRLAAGLTALDSTLTAPDGKREIIVPLGPSREATILASSSGTIEVRIACADNPMPPEVLHGVLWALNGVFDLGFTTRLPWEVVRIEANKDHIGFTIDGASAVTVNLRDFLFKAYQRPGILREEIVLHHIPLLEVIEHLIGRGAVGNARIAEANETMAKEFALMRRSYDALLIEIAELRKQRQDSGKTAK